MPEEDKFICVHDWRDLYGGDGVDRKDPYRVYQAFYCCKCLMIRVKSWNRGQYKLNPNFLEEFFEAGPDDNVDTAKESA